MITLINVMHNNKASAPCVSTHFQWPDEALSWMRMHQLYGAAGCLHNAGNVVVIMHTHEYVQNNLKQISAANRRLVTNMSALGGYMEFIKN